MTERIDAHHHMWKYSAEEYGWIDDRMARLRRDYLPADIEREAREAKIDGVVAVQARQSVEETDWLIALADECPLIRGVVGWAPIASPTFEQELERLTSQPKLKGLRHVIQGEADDNFILGAEFNAGIARIQQTRLIYDILIFERHLPQTIEFADRHPEQIFVLDHLAKPRIAEALMDPWRKHIADLAKRENVYCKVSGMVTEADWDAWSVDTLRPYWDVALESFGPHRLMAGSDWPVCLLASSYKHWFDTLKTWAAKLSETEQGRLFGGTATEVYKLG